MGERIIIDSREKRPYELPDAIIRTLKTSDYSIINKNEDFSDRISVERKSLPDLLGCIGRERERFERELARMALMPYPALVVEASLPALLRGDGRSQIHPSAVLGSLCAWSWRYRLPIWLAGDRKTATRLTERLLKKAIDEIVAAKVAA